MPKDFYGSPVREKHHSEAALSKEAAFTASQNPSSIYMGIHF